MTDPEEMLPMATTPFMLPQVNLLPTKLLVVDDNLASNNWQQWKKVWQRHKNPTRIFKEEDLV